MVILSFITTPNIRIIIFSYKLIDSFLIKNIKKHKKADKSDAKQEQQGEQAVILSNKKTPQKKCGVQIKSPDSLTDPQKFIE